MTSSPIICTCVFAMGFLLLVAFTQAASIHSGELSLDKIFDEDIEDANYPYKKRSLSNSDIPEGYVGIMLGKRRLGARGVRFPSDAVFLGKRRLPYEAVLLGKRDLPNEAILLGRRDLPNEAILLGKRDLPNEAVLLGKRDLPNEAVLLGKRDLPNEAVLLGKRR